MVEDQRSSPGLRTGAGSAMIMEGHIYKSTKNQQNVSMAFPIRGSYWLVDGLVAINSIFPLILGISSSQLTNIFQRGGPTTNQILLGMFHHFLKWI